MARSSALANVARTIGAYGSRFGAYVAQVLVPILRPGDTVVMDTFSSHKRTSVKAMIEARISGFVLW